MITFSQPELTASQKTERDLLRELSNFVIAAEEGYKSAVTLIWDNQYGVSSTGVAEILGSDGVAAFTLLASVKDALVALNSGVAIAAYTGLVGDYYPSISGDGAVIIGTSPY